MGMITYKNKWATYDNTRFRQYDTEPIPDWATDVKEETEETILRDVPEELKSALSQMAYEKGHSAGKDEVLTILNNLVNDLLPAIKAFETRIKGER